LSRSRKILMPIDTCAVSLTKLSLCLFVYMFRKISPDILPSCSQGIFRQRSFRTSSSPSSASCPVAASATTTAHNSTKNTIKTSLAALFADNNLPGGKFTSRSSANRRTVRKCWRKYSSLPYINHRRAPLIVTRGGRGRKQQTASNGLFPSYDNLEITFHLASWTFASMFVLK
jgi:hypothetical protein